MSKIITASTLSFNSGAFGAGRERKAETESRVLAVGKRKRNVFSRNKTGRVKLGLVGVCFVLAVGVAVLGAYYLYQVNDLATKSYDMKDMQVKIQDLEKENKKMRIREVELRSMYNLEKATQDLDLVNAQNVTYVEMKSPVAMK